MTCAIKKKNLVTENIGLSSFRLCGQDGRSIKVIFDPRSDVEKNPTMQDTGKAILGRGKAQM